MKKLAVLLALVGVLMLMASMVHARSEWAFYKMHPAKLCTSEGCVFVEDYTGPKSSELFEEGGPCYYLEKDWDQCLTLDCCACHGPNAPGNHGGPKLPASQCD